MLSFYVDPYDDGVSPDGHRAPGEQGPAWPRSPWPPTQSDIIPVKDMRHDFNDTKHHEVFYNLVSTTRFLEYFTETTTVKLSGTSRCRCFSKRFAAGTVVVMGTGDSRLGDLQGRRRFRRGRRGRFDRPHQHRVGA